METEQQRPIDIVAVAKTNDAFRREVITGKFEQVVVMAIPPGGEIGEEIHPDTDQVFLIVDGEGDAQLDFRSSQLRPNDLLVVRAGTRHNVVSIGPRWLRLITIYAPPQHALGTVHETKADADATERVAESALEAMR